jgi:hypothetical protein
VRRHVRPEVLAKRQLGALSARRVARIEAHISKCALCAETEAGLLAVSSLLAVAELPPMPEAIVQRIEIVIASESTARAVSLTAGASAQAAGTAGLADSADGLADSADGDAGASQPGHDEPVLVPGRPGLPQRAKRARPSRRFRLPSLSSPLVLRGMAATAAVVVVAGAGYLLANGQLHPNKAAGSQGVRAASPGVLVPSARLNGNAALRHRISVHYQLKGKTVATTAFVSKTNFLRHILARQVRNDVRQSARFGTNYSHASGGTAPSQPAATYGFSIPRLAGCLSRINAGRTVLLVAVARFLGKPARIIVLRPTLSASILDIAIVGPACSASSLDLIFRTRIPAG